MRGLANNTDDPSNNGDGSGEQLLMLNADKTFTLNHTYTDDGTYTATVKVTDEQGLVGTDTLTVTAQNAFPYIGAAAIAPVHERQLVMLQGTVGDANPFDPLTVTIDWGDFHRGGRMPARRWRYPGPRFLAEPSLPCNLT